MLVPSGDDEELDGDGTETRKWKKGKAARRKLQLRRRNTRNIAVFDDYYVGPEA